MREIDEDSIQSGDGTKAHITGIYHCKMCAFSTNKELEIRNHLETSTHLRMSKRKRPKSREGLFHCGVCGFNSGGKKEYIHHLEREDHVIKVKTNNVLVKNNKEDSIDDDLNGKNIGQTSYNNENEDRSRKKKTKRKIAVKNHCEEGETVKEVNTSQGDKIVKQRQKNIQRLKEYNENHDDSVSSNVRRSARRLSNVSSKALDIVSRNVRRVVDTELNLEKEGANEKTAMTGSLGTQDIMDKSHSVGKDTLVHTPKNIRRSNKTMEKQVEAAKLRVAINVAREEMGEAVAAQDFVKAQEAKCRLERLEAQRDRV